MPLSLDLENRIDALLNDIGRVSPGARRERVVALIEYALHGKEYDPNTPRRHK